MTEDVLLELGTEELPASFAKLALQSMPQLAAELLKKGRIDHKSISALGTPRRLALTIEQAASKQRDLSELVLGPKKSIAFDAEGKPTKAALGFAKKLGMPATAIQSVETEKGAYAAVQREERGRPTVEILGSIMPELCARIPFPKSMRWGKGTVSFGRPLHWIVCLWGETLVPFEFADVDSGRRSRGHRFLSPQEFDLRSASEYVDALRAHHVVVDVQKRRDQMKALLAAEAASLCGQIVEDEFLIEESVSLVEEPNVVAGSFSEEFLSLPEGVVISVMRNHQRYFALRSAADETLLPRYLNVVNTALNKEAIVKGNDRVLRARLSDARFFLLEDQKQTLESRVAGLDQVVFQHRLGSIGDKVRRLERLAGHLANSQFEPRTKPISVAEVKRSATLCKADLGTLVVGEFPELEGEMGRFYALRDEEPREVADAIRDHYLPKGANDALPSTVTGTLVGIADRLDTLVGCFGIGLTPSGSADPFALRRAALGVVRLTMEHIDIDLVGALDYAFDGYPTGTLGDRASTCAALSTFFRARVKSMFGSRYASDLIEACLAAWNGQSVRDFQRRLEAVDAFKKSSDYDALAVTYKRAYNIGKGSDPMQVETALLVEDAEKELVATLNRVRSTIALSVERRDYGAALQTVARDLRAPVDRFFDTVLVMDEDPAVRRNRLALCASVADVVKGIAHFNLIST